MNEATYCATVCHARCCSAEIPDEGEVVCPKLNGDCTCSVYARRYGPELGGESLVQVGSYYSSKYKQLNGMPAERTFFCGKVKDVHAQGRLPQEVADQCCVIHPELLEAWGK